MQYNICISGRHLELLKIKRSTVVSVLLKHILHQLLLLCDNKINHCYPVNLKYTIKHILNYILKYIIHPLEVNFKLLAEKFHGKPKLLKIK